MAERGLSADCRPHQGTAQESGDQSLGQTTEVTAACSKDFEHKSVRNAA